MTLFGFRPHWPSNAHGVVTSIPPPPAPKALSKNFHVCPHCQKCGRSPLLECLDDESPIISRSDGETFHLVLGDKPIWFPPENARGVGMATAGFWYVHEANSDLT